MISLVNYSSSEDEAETNSEPKQTPSSLVHENRILLPNPLKLLPATGPDDMDETGDHSGRVRGFAHERGIWATYVYVSCRYYIL